MTVKYFGFILTIVVVEKLQGFVLLFTRIFFQKLAEEIPQNNDTAKDANDAVEKLTATTEKIKALKARDESEDRSLEADRCNEQLKDLNDRWAAVKEEIARQLARLDEDIAKVESGKYFLCLPFSSTYALFIACDKRL